MVHQELEETEARYNILNQHCLEKDKSLADMEAASECQNAEVASLQEDLAARTKVSLAA